MAAAVQAPERLVILEPVSWETYERLLEEQQGRGGTRFTYDTGLLEIMVLSIQHERLNGILTTLVDLLVLEFRLDSESLGSTTFRRPDLQQGFEPDSCFYIQNAVPGPAKPVCAGGGTAQQVGMDARRAGVGAERAEHGVTR